MFGSQRDCEGVIPHHAPIHQVPPVGRVLVQVTQDGVVSTNAGIPFKDAAVEVGIETVDPTKSNSVTMHEPKHLLIDGHIGEQALLDVPVKSGKTRTQIIVKIVFERVSLP